MITAFPWKRALRSKSVWFSLIVITLFTIITVFAPLLAPHDPLKWANANFSLPPMWVDNQSHPGNPEFPLGTDRFGRDILSRLIYGTRTEFILAVSAVSLAALIGTLVGLVAGYAGGILDTLFIGFSDIIQSLAGIMFAVIIILIFRNLLSPSWFHGLVTLVIGFAAVSWVNLARLVRINVMLVKTQLFIEAAVSIGASQRRIITDHILPNVIHVILVWIINAIPAVILLEAVLGYIGVPITSAITDNDFTTISWGGLFFSGRSTLNSNPLILIIPSAGILLISMSFIFLADFLKSLSRNE